MHPFFNGSVLTLLARYKLDVPLVGLQADIINIHKSWCDPRATLTISPTPEAFETSVKLHGMPPEKWRFIGFPTRPASATTHAPTSTRSTSREGR